MLDQHGLLHLLRVLPHLSISLSLPPVPSAFAKQIRHRWRKSRFPSILPIVSNYTDAVCRFISPDIISIERGAKIADRDRDLIIILCGKLVSFRHR